MSSTWIDAAGYGSLLLAIGGALHAYVLAAKYPDARPRPGYSRRYGLLGAAAGLAALAFLTRAFLFEPFRAPSASMLPTIPLRARLVVQKWGYGNYGSCGLRLLHTPITSSLARGDLVVFEQPSNRSVSYVKRLVGLPGDRNGYRGRLLFINGEAAALRPDGDFFDAESLRHLPRFVEALSGHEHRVLIGKSPDCALSRTPRFPYSENCVYAADAMTCEVPAGHFFMLGDNRDNSSDSRMWGFVPADQLAGKVVFVVS